MEVKRQNFFMKNSIFLACVFVTILQVGGAHYGPKINSVLDRQENQRDIVDALYQIAQVLQNSQQDAALQERIAILETKLSLSNEKNSALEKRIAAVEKEIPGLNKQLENSENILLKASNLEAQTKNLMDEFEEKLGALAGEILRLKSSAGKAFAIPLNPKYLLDNEDDFKNIEWIVKCSAKPSDSNYTRNQSICLSSPRDKVANWTVANHVCKLNDGLLASSFDIEGSNLLHGLNMKIWISNESRDKAWNSNASAIDTWDLYKKKNYANNTNVNILQSGHRENESFVAFVDHEQNNTIESNENIQNGVIASVKREFKIINDFLTPTDNRKNLSENINGLMNQATTRTSEEDFDDTINSTSNSELFKEFLLLQPDEVENSKNSILGTNLNEVDLVSLFPEDLSKKGDNNVNYCSVLICGKFSCVIDKRICSDFNKFWCMKASTPILL